MSINDYYVQKTTRYRLSLLNAVEIYRKHLEHRRYNSDIYMEIA
jgi:hypothetical protein